MSDGDIHRQLKKGIAFEESDLYKKIFKIAEKKAGKHFRARCCQDPTGKPKITRNLTTAWFAKRVDDRRASCMARR